MAFIDYYKILEIDKSATVDDIKKAYRKMARKYHPDLNPNDAVAVAKFKENNEANEVLSNPENRKKYDKKNNSNTNEVSKAIMEMHQKMIIPIFLNPCLVVVLQEETVRK